MDSIAPGERVEIVATDAGFARDSSDWRATTGNKLIEKKKEKNFRGIATRADITRVTRRLGDEIAHVYGFPIPRRQAPVQER